MISVQNVTKRFSNITALNAISFEVQRGEFFGLVGPNGAGKTTLMNLLIGQRSPDEGSLTIFGEHVSPDDPSIRLRIGFVPQAIALYDELSAHDNLLIFGRFYGLDRRTLKARIDEVMSAVQLSDRRHDRVKNFSGGMKRRLNVAASLLHHPELLLCDEPTVGVDPQSRNAIFDLLTSLNAGGTTIVYTSHYMEEIERLCTRTAIIDHGMLQAEGTTRELLRLLPFDETLIIKRSQETDGLEPALKQFGDVIGDQDKIELKPRSNTKISDALAVLERAGVTYSNIDWRKPTLEDLFLHLTGRRMRD